MKSKKKQYNSGLDINGFEVRGRKSKFQNKKGTSQEIAVASVWRKVFESILHVDIKQSDTGSKKEKALLSWETGTIYSGPSGRKRVKTSKWCKRPALGILWRRSILSGYLVRSNRYEHLIGFSSIRMRKSPSCSFTSSHFSLDSLLVSLGAGVGRVGEQRGQEDQFHFGIQCDKPHRNTHFLIQNRMTLMSILNS